MVVLVCMYGVTMLCVPHAPIPGYPILLLLVGDPRVWEWWSHAHVHHGMTVHVGMTPCFGGGIQGITTTSNTWFRGRIPSFRPLNKVVMSRWRSGVHSVLLHVYTTVTS